MPVVAAAAAAAAESASAPPPPLTFAEGQRWCELIESRCGVHFPESQWHYLRRRLWDRLRRQPEGGSYAQYYRLLAATDPRQDHGSPAAIEWKRLMEDLLNPETSFFRHRPSFDALGRSVLPGLRREPSSVPGPGRADGSPLLTGLGSLARALHDRPSHSEPCRLWSAGCSTGEEAYSLAMTALSLRGSAEVHGTDLSDTSLDRARTGIYSPRQMASVPAAWRSLYFLPAHAGYCEAAPCLREAVRFAPFHLLDPATYPAREFDVIFCFNVLIYFRRPAREQALSALIGRLKPGGYLFMAPGENAGLKLAGAEPARLEGATVLRRAAA